MDDSQLIDSAAKLAARLDAQLDHYANVGSGDLDSQLTAIGERFAALRPDDNERHYGLWLRLALTAAQLRSSEKGTVPGVASSVLDLALQLVDLAILIPSDRHSYLEKGELDELADKLDTQADICRGITAVIRAQSQ